MLRQSELRLARRSSELLEYAQASHPELSELGTKLTVLHEQEIH